MTDEQSIFREKLAELENVIRLKDEQLAMKEERSLLRDATIGDLKGDLDKQYYAHLDEMDRMKLELDEAKARCKQQITFFESLYNPLFCCICPTDSTVVFSQHITHGSKSSRKLTPKNSVRKMNNET